MVDSEMVSAKQPDWSRERRHGWAWDPARALLASIRSYQDNVRPGIYAYVMRKIAVARHRFWSAVSAADIPINCKIGGGLIMPHPSGIVIHPEAVLGPNCLIFQQVTIGASRRGVPTIGGHVDIGAGAKIIGPVTIGDHVVIGANALVIFDVPDGAVVRGAAASIVPFAN